MLPRRDPLFSEIRDPADTATTESARTMSGGPFLLTGGQWRLAIVLVLALLAAPGNSQPPDASQPGEAGPKTEDARLPGASPDESLTDLPKLDTLQLPSVEQCLKGPVQDWLVLVADHVLVVEPIERRPGVLEDTQRRIKELLTRPGRETPEERHERLALNYLTVTLVDEPEQDYRLDIKYILRVIYFEDQMLSRVDALLDAKNVREAFQVLLALERRHRNWPGFSDRQKRLLFVEAGLRAEMGEPQVALGLLEDLFAQDKAYPELGRKAGEVVDLLVAEAVAANDYRQARHFLRRLTAIEAENPVARRRSDELLGLARDAMARARTAEQQRQYDAAARFVEEAAHIWPDTPELNQTHRRIVARFQRLKVGVWELAPAGPGSPSSRDADRRRKRLEEIPLFRPQRMGRKVVRLEAPLLQGWEPADLGHSLHLQVRTHRNPWESLPEFSAGDLALAIADRLDPRNPAYDERMATFVESISVQSPRELSIQFRSVPLRPEALFLFPVTPGRSRRQVLPAMPDDQQASAGSGGSGNKDTWPFRQFARDENSVTWRRAIPEPEQSSERAERHVAEVIEVLYPSPEKAIQGLVRGEVHIVPRVPAWTVSDLEATNNFYLLRYDLPETHVVHFRPDGQKVRNRELRRALAYALDRPRMLDEVFLRGASTLGQVASGLAPSTSYASNPAVVPHPSDPALSLSLLPAIRKEFAGKLPELTMACPPDPHIQTAARKLVETWKRLGLTITVVPEDATDWDLAYQVIRMAEPLVELWPTLTCPHGTDVASLRSLSPWLREQLLALDQASDASVAESLLHRIHAQAWAEVYVIPLWELQPVMAVRKNIRGMPDRPFVTYDGVERWQVESYYARE